MTKGVPLLFVVGLGEEVVEAAETAVGPAVGEVCGGLEGVDESVVLVVLFVGLPNEDEPDPPFVEEQLTLKHIIIS